MPRNQDDACPQARGTPLDEVLRLGSRVGWQRLGMVALYYRAGMSQEDIARVFNVRRQVVSYQLRRAFEMATEQLRLEHKCSRQSAARARLSRGPARSRGKTT